MGEVDVNIGLATEIIASLDTDKKKELIGKNIMRY